MINLKRIATQNLLIPVLNHPRIALLLSLGLFLSSLVGIPNLEVSTDNRMFFDPDNPQLLEYENLQETYSRDDSILIAVAAADGTIFKESILHRMAALTEDVWDLPHVRRVDSLTNFLHSEAGEDGLVVSELFTAEESLGEDKLQRIKGIASQDPLIYRTLVSEDLSTALISITFDLPSASSETIFELMDQTGSLVDRYASPDVELHISGNIPAGFAFASTSLRDLKTLIPIMHIVLLFALYFFLRSFTSVMLTFGCILFSTGVAMGWMGLFGLSLNASTSIAPVIIMTLAVADSVHFMLTFLWRKHSGDAHRDAIIYAFNKNFMPIFLTSITTCIGFLSLNFNEVPPFRDLGNIVSMGVLSALFFTAITLPALLMHLPHLTSRRTPVRSTFFSWIQHLVNRRTIWIVVGFSAMLVFLGMQIPKMVVDDSVVKYFGPEIEFRQDTDFMIQKMGGFDRIEYSIEAGAWGEITNPAYLAFLEDFVQYAKSKDSVASIQWIGNVFQKIHMNLHEDQPAFYKLPESREAAAQHLLLYEMSLPFGRDLRNQINFDKTASRLTILLNEVTTYEILDLTRDFDHWLQTERERIFSEPEGVVASQGSGLTVVFANIYKENIHGMLWGFVFAVLLITLTLTVTFYSVKSGIVSMIPNLVPVVIAYGIWYFISGQIDLASSAIAMIVIGVVVDDTVHFLYRFHFYKDHEKREFQECLRQSLEGVGPALTSTTLVLVLGFSLLCFSDFKLNQSLGFLASLSIGSALITDILLLPAILKLIYERKGEQDVELPKVA